MTPSHSTATKLPEDTNRGGELAFPPNSGEQFNLNHPQPSDEAAMHDMALVPAATSAGPTLRQGLASYPCFDAANATTNIGMTDDIGGRGSTMQSKSDASSDLSDSPLTPSATVAFAGTPEMMEIDNPTPINEAEHLGAVDEHLERASPEQIPSLDGASEGVNPVQTKKRTIPMTGSSNQKRAKKDVWSAEHVIQNETSPLAFCDLKSILSNPDAFTSLKPEQKEHLLSMMPTQKHIIVDADGERKIDPRFLKYDSDWRHYLSRFQEDIAEGRNDPEWLRQAITSFEQRKVGAFDSFKEQEYEEFWGVKQKLPHNVVAGMTSYVKWESLFFENILQVGDILLHKRNHRQGKGVITIEKEATVILRNPDNDFKGFPTLSIPPGQYKMSNPELREDIILHNVPGPENLVKAISTEDGRLKTISNGNGWKSIRVIRKNQDLGSLWDIRQAYHFSQNEGDYKSILSHVLNHPRRATKSQQLHGFCWVNPVQVLVKKIHISDLAKQHPHEILPICEDLAARLTNIAPPGYTFVKCDPRIMRNDGIPCPISDTLTPAENLLRTLKMGPNAFPTPFTKGLAAKHGWTFGHAHLGAAGMKFSLLNVCTPTQAKTQFIEGFLDGPVDDSRRRNVIPDKNLFITHEERSNLKSLFLSDQRFTTQEECHLMAHLRPRLAEDSHEIGNAFNSSNNHSTFNSAYGEVWSHINPQATSGGPCVTTPVQTPVTSDGAPYARECTTNNYSQQPAEQKICQSKLLAVGFGHQNSSSGTHIEQDSNDELYSPKLFAGDFGLQESSLSNGSEQEADEEFNPPKFDAEDFDAHVFPGEQFLWSCFNIINSSLLSGYPAPSDFNGPILSHSSSVTADTSDHTSTPGESKAHEFCLQQNYCHCPQTPTSPSYEVELDIDLSNTSELSPFYEHRFESDRLGQGDSRNTPVPQSDNMGTVFLANDTALSKHYVLHDHMNPEKQLTYVAQHAVGS